MKCIGKYISPFHANVYAYAYTMHYSFDETKTQ